MCWTRSDLDNLVCQLPANISIYREGPTLGQPTSDNTSMQMQKLQWKMQLVTFSFIMIRISFYFLCLDKYNKRCRKIECLTFNCDKSLPIKSILKLLYHLFISTNLLCSVQQSIQTFGPRSMIQTWLWFIQKFLCCQNP